MTTGVSHILASCIVALALGYTPALTCASEIYFDHGTPSGSATELAGPVLLLCFSDHLSRKYWTQHVA